MGGTMSEDKKENKVVKFNPDEVMARLKAKIKDAFIEIIPEEEWEDMIRKQYKSFFLDSQKKSGYGNDTIKVPSEFSTLAQEILKDIARDKMIKILNSPKYKITNLINAELPKAINKMIIDSAPQIIESMIKQHVGFAVQQMQNYQR